MLNAIPWEVPAAIAGGVVLVLALPRAARSMRGSRHAQPRDHAAKWLSAAMVALVALAGAAAVVSYQAQYALVLFYKGSHVIAAIQAAIPDVGALVFACLAVALALQGRRAVRPRVLNIVCVGISIGMNALAAAAGWTGLAVWTMAPVLYALASDTLITVVRAWSIARQREIDGALADDDGSPVAIAGSAALWLLRLIMAPRSTLGGFRAWVLEEVRVAPGRRAPRPLPAVPATAPLTVSLEVPSESGPEALEAPAEDTSEDTIQKPPVSAVKRVRKLGGRKATDEDMLDAMRELAEDGSPVTKTRVVRELPVGEQRAGRLMVRWNNDHQYLTAVR